jgi:hypothetical protein
MFLNLPVTPNRALPIPVLSNLIHLAYITLPHSHTNQFHPENGGNIFLQNCQYPPTRKFGIGAQKIKPEILFVFITNMIKKSYSVSYNTHCFSGK